jgi:hypothetical protein
VIVEARGLVGLGRSAAVCRFDSALRSASERTSSATTAKPRPCSPARAASIAALRASRFVWNAICSIVLRMRAVASAADRMSPIAPDSSSIRSTPCRVLRRVSVIEVRARSASSAFSRVPSRARQAEGRLVQCRLEACALGSTAAGGEVRRGARYLGGGGFDLEQRGGQLRGRPVDRVMQFAEVTGIVAVDARGEIARRDTLQHGGCRMQRSGDSGQCVVEALGEIAIRAGEGHRVGAVRESPFARGEDERRRLVDEMPQRRARTLGRIGHGGDLLLHAVEGVGELADLVVAVHPERLARRAQDSGEVAGRHRHGAGPDLGDPRVADLLQAAGMIATPDEGCGRSSARPTGRRGPSSARRRGWSRTNR